MAMWGDKLPNYVSPEAVRGTGNWLATECLRETDEYVRNHIGMLNDE